MARKRYTTEQISLQIAARDATGDAMVGWVPLA